MTERIGASEAAMRKAKELARIPAAYGIRDAEEVIASALDDYAREQVAATWEAAAQEIPNNWLDPLLTGPTAVVPKECDSTRIIEKVLWALGERLRARAAAASTPTQREIEEMRDRFANRPNHVIWSIFAIHDAIRAERDRLLADLLERDMTWLPAKDAEIERLRAALKGVALNGSDDMPLWSWCDEGWTCEHEECIAGRAALAPSEKP